MPVPWTDSFESRKQMEKDG